MAAHLLDLNDSVAADPAVAGGKAAGLARMIAGGIQVPAGVVIPAGVAGDDSSLQTLVARAVELLGEGPLAVRSSSTAEDTAESSFAGQFETVLGVHGVEQAVDAVRHCLASASANRVAAYRSGAGGAAPAGKSDKSMAVLIQRQVQAEASGVAFTANPVTGERGETLISAVRGLGDRLVSGQAAADEWVVRSGEARCLASPEEAVDEKTVLEIAGLARRVEEIAGVSQDVEWAIAGGKVHLLQARPITALPTPPQINPPPGPWFKDTVHYTGPLSPLTSSAYLPRLEAGLAAALDEFGLMLERVQMQTIGWESYSQPVPPSQELAGRRIGNAIAAIDEGRPAQVVQEWREGLEDEFARQIAGLRALDLAGLNDAGLSEHLESCLQLLTDGQIAHFRLFIPWLLAAFDLKTSCEELLGWDLPAALELVTGLSQATSAPTRELEALAATVRSTPGAAEFISEWEPGQPADGVIARLAGIDATLADGLTEHLDHHGCRVPAYDVGDPTFLERPELTLRLLADLVAAPGSGAGAAAELDRRREGAAEAARTELKEREASPQDIDRFERALAQARDLWGLREANLLLTDSTPNGLLRLAALEAGRRLSAHGRLRRPDDAVWLDEDELRAATAGNAAPDLSTRVARRRAEQAWVRANPGPALYGDPPKPPPPMDQLPPQARYVNEALIWMMGVEFHPPGAGGDGPSLQGMPGSPGRVRATARILRDEADFNRLGPGEIMVCRLTTPAWTVLFSRAAAVVTECGSPLSHAAIVAREHAVPAVVGAPGATATIADGQTVTVDGSTGLVTWAGQSGQPKTPREDSE